MTTVTWTQQHLIGLDGLKAEEITFLMDAAERHLPVVRGEARATPSLAGRIVANIFFEDSTRTRTSFSIAARRLGAEVVDLLGTTSSRSKGETLLDTVRIVEAMGVDAIVVRTSAAGAPAQISRRVACPIINAGDGRHEHPTQGLLDLLTLRCHLGSLAGKTVAIVGDILNSRVARSVMHGLSTLGANIRLVGPGPLAPRELEQITDGPGSVTVCRDLDAVLPRVDAVIMLRVQFEREAGAAIPSIAQYRDQYALSPARAAMLPEHAVIMHPGPINRGLELDGEVADDPVRSVILVQVTNGVAVRMAVLETLILPAN